MNFKHEMRETGGISNGSGPLHWSYFNVEMEYLQRKASISERTMNGSFDLCRRHTQYPTTHIGRSAEI